MRYLTLALASLAASASAAMARWSCTGKRTSFLKRDGQVTSSPCNETSQWKYKLTSPLSQPSPPKDQSPHPKHFALRVKWPRINALLKYPLSASYRRCYDTSLSDNISLKFLVPSTFLSVVAASSRVEWLAVYRAH